MVVGVDCTAIIAPSVSHAFSNASLQAACNLCGVLRAPQRALGPASASFASSLCGGAPASLPILLPACEGAPEGPGGTKMLGRAARPRDCMLPWKLPFVLRPGTKYLRKLCLLLAPAGVRRRLDLVGHAVGQTLAALG